MVDLGSGAGFPGLVLALLSGRPTHLVESDQRKAAFLGEVARATGCAGRVQIHAVRVEALKPWAHADHHRPRFGGSRPIAGLGGAFYDGRHDLHFSQGCQGGR